jgi:hypothetical protein
MGKSEIYPQDIQIYFINNDTIIIPLKKFSVEVINEDISEESVDAIVNALIHIFIIEEV